MKPQWWVNCTPLAQEAIARTRAGDLLVAPKTSEAEWFRWLEGMHDWCISRQLWWGHRCPAYFVRMAGVAQDVRACGRPTTARVLMCDAGDRREVVGRGPLARAGGGAREGPCGWSRVYARAGRGRARHVVLVRPLAVLHPWLAGEGTDQSRAGPPDLTPDLDGRLRKLLPGVDPRDRLGHHLLLGRAHGHARAQADRPVAVQGGAVPRDDPRRARAQDVQVTRERDRPAGRDPGPPARSPPREARGREPRRERDREGDRGPEEGFPEGHPAVRYRRAPLRALRVHGRRARHQPRDPARRGLPQVLQQDLQRNQVRDASARRRVCTRAHCQSPVPSLPLSR
jgi:hypothetical protein